MFIIVNRYMTMGAAEVLDGSHCGWMVINQGHW